MKELVVISGKGGTGKTSFVASFAALSGNAVVTDCDVDAPDLHLVLGPVIEHREPFIGGKLARIDAATCTRCGECVELCRFDAVTVGEDGEGPLLRTFSIDPVGCEGCGVCAWFCPESAIAFKPAVRGEWYRSATRYGPMIHARLGAAASNSGRLVTVLREEARRVAEAAGKDLVIIDGSPGIGCPVIASVTGATLVLAVTEPSVSGEHDLLRVLGLAKGFGIPSAVCVNRADVDPEIAARIEARAAEAGATVLPRVRFDRAVTDAQARERPVVELDGSGAAEDLRKVWGELWGMLRK
jgi:MinD superfamily P-loop ATPase